MLAKFENGYFLEVVHNEEDNNYDFTIYDKNMEYEDDGYTEHRSIDMYYPMNEIDYILEFCEPDYVDGKYELLEFETMEEYEKHMKEFLKEYTNGEWLLERKGTEYTDKRKFKTEEAAQRILKMEYEEMLEDYDCPMSEEIEENYAHIGDEEFYQSWTIYKKKTYSSTIEELIDKINMELNRADTGVSQYAFELQDTSVVSDHIYKAQRLLSELKEMIK